MKFIILRLALPAFGLLIGAPLSLAAPPLELAPLLLGVGEQRLLRVPGLERYSLGSPCLRAKSQENTLLIKATCAGMSDLWVWKKDTPPEHRTIRIEKTPASPLAHSLEKALGQLEEVEVLIAGPGVVLRGEIRTLSEASRVQTLTQGFTKEIQNEAQPTEDLLEQGRKRLKAWLREPRNSALASRLQIETQGRQLFVRGSLERASSISTIEKQVRTLYPLAVQELDALPDSAPTVHFRVFLLEIKKTQGHNIGLSWPALQEGAFRVTTSQIQDALALDLALQAMEQTGELRVLSNPELVVRAPGEAELFAGGEMPLVIKTQQSKTVLWRKFGLTLHLKVTHSAGERVRLEISTEVSHMDHRIAMDDIPGLQTNQMKTQVDARYGTPLFLSGLLREDIREEAKGLPLLRNIPVLGALFGSDNYLNERSELVAILLPSATPPRPPMEKLRKHVAAGPLPPARNWITPEDERALRASKEWPWNALN